MSTMNSEIYAALIDAGSSKEKAKAAAIIAPQRVKTDISTILIPKF